VPTESPIVASTTIPIVPTPGDNTPEDIGRPINDGNGGQNDTIPTTDVVSVEVPLIHLPPPTFRTRRWKTPPPTGTPLILTPNGQPWTAGYLCIDNQASRSVGINCASELTRRSLGEFNRGDLIQIAVLARDQSHNYVVTGRASRPKVAYFAKTDLAQPGFSVGDWVWFTILAINDAAPVPSQLSLLISQTPITNSQSL